MRICDTSVFPLTLEIQHTQGLPEDCGFMFRDSDFMPLSTTCTYSRDTTKIKSQVWLPLKLIIEIRSDSTTDQLNLATFNLAGISVKKDKLLHCLEYRHGSVDISNNQLLNLPAKKTLTWTPPCCVLVDLFDPNPFAWHLHIGNKIQFR